MSKINSVFVLFFALFYSNLEIRASESANVTRQWKTEFNGRNIPPIVKVKDQLFFANMYNNSVHMWTIYDNFVNNTCKFVLPANKTFLHDMKRTVALGNGKIVFQGLLAPNPEEELITYWDLYVIVDPYNCSSIKTLLVDGKDSYYAFESTIPYQNSFDLFAPNRQSEKAVRRFNDQGKPILLEQDLKLNTSLFRTFIEPILPYDSSEGYICKHISKYGYDYVTQLLRFDSKFQLVKDATISIRPDIDMSVTYGKVVSLCHEYFDHDVSKFSVTCDLYDSKDLSSKGSVAMYRSDKSYSDVDFRVVNLPDGSVVVALGFQLKGSETDSTSGLTTDYYLQRINVDGVAEEPLHVDTFYNSMNIRGDMSTLLFNESEVCLFIKDMLAVDPLKERLIMKCINTSN